MTALIIAIVVFVIGGLTIKGLLSNRKPSSQPTNEAHHDETNLKIGTATAAAGAALAYQMWNHRQDHHATDMTNDRDDLWDEEWDEWDDEVFEDELYNNHISEIAAQEVEQIAYDDYIASLDMTDD